MMNSPKKAVEDSFWKIHQAVLDLFLTFESFDENDSLFSEVWDIQKAVLKSKRNILGNYEEKEPESRIRKEFGQKQNQEDKDEEEAPGFLEIHRE